MTAVPVAAPAAESTERLRVSVAGKTHVFDGPTGELGKLSFHRDAQGWTLVDRGVKLGLYLDGCRVQQLPLFAGRAVTVGIGKPQRQRITLEVTASVLPEPQRAPAAPVSSKVATPARLPSAKPLPPPALVVDRLAYDAPSGRRLLDQVTLALPERSLTAVIGPSGAGKSTLLRLLTGQARPSSGQVRWHGADVHAEYDALRYRIGLVPQEEILHPQLTVRQGLEYAARLRLPEGTTASEREARVDEVVERMGLQRQAGQRIGGQLSGGQRKRVSIATELLTAPPLLFLDEPTSGLDPGMDRSVMHELRGLADEGRTVVVATHSVMGLDVCDTVVVLARGGSVAFVGAPDEVLAHFGCAGYPELFDLLETRALPRHVHPRGIFAGERTRALLSTRAPSPGSQLRTLVRRNVAVLFADRFHLALLLALPLVLAGLARLVQGSAGLSMALTKNPAGQLIGTEPSQRLTILVMAAVLMGVAMTIRELVSERAIFRREYAVGLSPGTYYASKAIVLATACFGQGLIVAGIALAGMPGQDGHGVRGWGWWEIGLPIGILAALSALVGLAVSARVRAIEHAMPALVAVVMVQLVLSSAIVRMAGRPLLDNLSWLAPSRWAYAASASSVQLEKAHKFDPAEITDPLFQAASSQWLQNIGALLLLALVIVAVGLRAVRRSARV